MVGPSYTLLRAARNGTLVRQLVRFSRRFTILLNPAGTRTLRGTKARLRLRLRYLTHRYIPPFRCYSTQHIMRSPLVSYAEQLIGQGHGFPLWHPEPGPYGEVQIGDVGFFSKDAFIRLFNVMRSKDDVLNKDGVPVGFVQLETAGASGLQQHHRTLPPGYIVTEHVKLSNLQKSDGIET